METKKTFHVQSILEACGCPPDCLSWCDAFLSEVTPSEASQSPPAGAAEGENAAGPTPSQMEDWVRIMEEFMRSCWPAGSDRCGSPSDEPSNHEPTEQ